MRIAWFVLFIYSITAHANYHMATPYSERVYITQNVKAFINDINQKTDINVVFHPAESLYKHNEIYRAVRTNQIQFGEIFIGQLSNHSAIFQLDNLPFIATSFDQAKQLWQYQQTALRQALAKDGLQLLFVNPWPPQGLFTDKQINTGADLQGLKIRSYSAITAQLASHLNMIPIALSSGEIAQAFATGMVNAMITSPATGVSSRAWQFSQYYMPINAWIPKNMIVMNQNAYLALSAKDKTMLKTLIQKHQALAWQKAQTETTKVTNILEQKGMIIAPINKVLHGTFSKVGDAMSSNWKKIASTEEVSALSKFKEQLRDSKNKPL